MNASEGSEGSNGPAPLALDLSAPAKAQARDARTWLFGFSEQAAERFNSTLQRELSALCQDVASRFTSGERAGSLGRLPEPDPAASLHFSRPVFQHRFTTSATRRKRRGSSAGVWRVFYALADRDGDGRPDTLTVLSIRHGAAAPLGTVVEETGEESENGA